VAASDHLSNKPVSAEPADEPRLDRTKFSVVGIDEPDDSLAYWLTRPIEERLQALERLRRISYGHTIATGRLQRVIEVVQLDWR
jgi:hypothetical protein